MILILKKVIITKAIVLTIQYFLLKNLVLSANTDIFISQPLEKR